MMPWIVIVVLFGVIEPDSAATVPTPPDSIGRLDLATVARYFAEFDSVCARDSGALWGVSYSGPFLIADPVSRSVAANRADPGGRLVARGGLSVGILPPEVPVANTAVDWLGTRWTMVMAGALSPNARPRLRLMAHEAFHRLQPKLGLEASGPMNEHLDTREGRFWMQLEWNALQRALLANGAARRAAVADAQRFRAVRRGLFSEARTREIALEIQEGLAEYAGARLLDYSDSLVVRMVAARREWDTAFVRSFAYLSGPLYGFLLDGASRDWRRGLAPNSDLGDLLRAALHLMSPTRAEVTVAAARRRAASYGGDTLWATETARDEQRTTRLAEWRRTLIAGPVLIVDLKKVQSSSFDPGAVFPMGDGSTVYGTRSLIGDWGRLDVQDGAILENPRAGEGRVALTGAAADRLSGEGWILTLADGWQTTPAKHAGDFELTKR